MKDKILCVYKPLGLTPLQAIHHLRHLYPEYRQRKIGYAGRLDPLAEGLLLLLLDDENKEKMKYENLPKVYECEILFGISTDTYDTLGLITESSKQQLVVSTQQISALLPSFVGKQLQPYPPYSSKTIQGKPLYRWARDGKLNGIDIPEREIEISSLELLSPTSLSTEALKKEVVRRTSSVQGVFRQNEITSSWQSFFDSTSLSHFPLLHFRLSCSSGTYVRSLAHSMGQRIKKPSIAYSIKRTALGPYSLKNCLHLDPIA